MIVNRKIPLGEGANGLYGGMLYTNSVTVSRQSAVVRLPSNASLDSVDPDSIDDIFDASVNRHLGDERLDYDVRPRLPDKRYDDRFGNVKY
ncbi:hypothetical protein KAR91_27205 [Candidatus Pacearchaeota archaeon]|nr:hypothetical protein [Candidatus Pacearchaeota archaeon]